MDDPTRRCENDTDKWKRVTRGSCSQARAPLFCPSNCSAGRSPRSPVAFLMRGRPLLPSLANLIQLEISPPLIDLLRYRNIQMPQHMLYFRLPQP
jgi:hypothetical protein